jgi:FKBP-type peptidyl-prolyl cis-trans isomerase
MEDMNRFLIKKDREIILNYIERKGLVMQESPTGLWYQILNEGNGTFFKDNSHITLEFECKLLDGSECYSSKNSGPKEVVLGRSNMESGLNEGLRLLKPGAEAIFILPPYMAFGLPGDGKKIPPRSIIVYEIKIKEP